ncbi:GL10115 [Drosophila persimilis]|uniref:GL10115 n=1 Tax=Drosophila persimilis TaxID=7234 RepID=B4H543_DROPE|nr:GL10115 [Drosophila persimilis]
MSLKRYATLLAAVTPQNPPNATTRAVSTVVSITTIAPSSSSSVAPSSSSSSSSEESQSQSQEHGTSSSSSSFTTYYSSGLGLYHQRGVSGSAGSVGGGGGAAGAGGPQTYANVVNGNVNLLLGGAMLSLVTTILCVVCYCCHRNIKKRTEAAYRQQQHQWLETDPNMEIYSVEQCYETSGLFLGDSTDGLSVMPTLHHEPPPSYDAVVLHEQQLLQQQQQHQQQLEQLQLQQQQILMQRISPPPGYRSSLDISTHHHPHGPVGGCSRGTPDGSVDAMASGSGAIRGGGGGAAAAGCGAAVNKELQLALNAQSCCSLQRAEVESMWNATEMESMWNAGAAAVAARRGNCLEMETVPRTTSATSSARNEEELAAASQDLSNINENGFISLDMSKIIDRSGLPTYEGALKLESSGYV